MMVDVNEGGDRLNAFDHIHNFFQIRLIYPHFQTNCAWLSFAFHLGFTVLLSVPPTPFKYFDDRCFPLAVILFILWPCFFLLLRLLHFVEEHARSAVSDRNGLLFSLSDALIAIGLAIGSTYVLEKLHTNQHFAGVLCLLVALTLLELWLLENRDFGFGDCLFNVATGTALLKFKDWWHCAVVVVIFFVRKGSLVFAKRMLLARKNEGARAQETAIQQEVGDAFELALRAEFEIVRNQMEETSERTLNSVRSEHEAAIMQLRTEFEGAINQREAHHEMTLRAVRSGHEAMIMQLRTELESARKQMEVEFQMNLETVRSGHEAAIMQQREEHATIVDALEKQTMEYALEISALKQAKREALDHHASK